ncbi:hypothetical protein MLD38_029927 [Melastoma candidum]|uniref:Uncharacterized protein n=1 Tax=Melastoma candidum TaxID=119954 RepID=A0ACB9MKS0_9MYRT|nr:hypothetical protein MLD38_029927 [Melastoma candidum]
MSKSDAMSMEIKKKHYHAFPTVDEEFKPMARKSSKSQQNLKKMDNQVKLPRGSEGVKYPGKSRVEGDWRSANASESSSWRLNVDLDARASQQKSSRDSKNQKGKGDSMETNELVKHMTHLPDYLQHAERRETVQEKALNVGVLDWRRLEKFTQKSKSWNVGGVLNTDSLSSTALDCNEKINKSNKPLSRSYPGLPPMKGKHHRAASELGISSSDFKNCAGRNDEKASEINGCAKDRDEEGMTPCANVMHDMKIDSLKVDIASLSKIRQRQHSASLKEKDNMENDGRSKRSIDPPASETNVLEMDCIAKHSGTVLFPRRRRNSSSLEASQHGDCMKMSGQDLMEAHQICSSGRNTKQLSSGIRTTETPNCLDGASQVFKSGNQLPDNDNPQKNVADPRSASKAWKFESVHQESAELASQKDPPSRRFNLSGLSRSFSYKEGKSSVGNTSTVIPGRSGLIRSADSLLIKEKQNSPSKSRFSSVRKLFDPILKYKPATSNSCVEDARVNLNSSIQSSLNGNESRPEKKPGLTFQALLQFAVLNEGPVLKFVVGNNHQILICSMKDLTSSENSVSSKRAFTFYSLEENKRKSGSWVGQGSKTKSGEFVCSEVAHMSMTWSENLTGNPVEREYVLFSSEMGNSGKENRFSDSAGRVEFAAIVSKVPIHACKHQNKYIDLVEGIVPGKRCSCGIASNDYGSTTVIIPGAIHSLPDNGEPSSLISRWRSGGSCDCGGWDVGCKLNILSNKKVSCEMPKPLDSCSTSKCFELILQGESDSNVPIFSLKPGKEGVYTVKFDSFISSLQAFSICVTFISSRAPSKPLNTSHFARHKESGELSYDQNSSSKLPPVPKVEGPGKTPRPKHLPLTPLDRV